MQTAEVAFGCAGKRGAPQDLGFHGVLWVSAEASLQKADGWDQAIAAVVKGRLLSRES